MQTIRIAPQQNLRVSAEVPGDKSVSHRAVIFASLAAGTSTVRNLLESEDCLHTLKIFQKMGIRAVRKGRDVFVIRGLGLRGLKAPATQLYCGNSGTTMRLLAGLLAAQPFSSVLTGDPSLSRRPMDRVIAPLARMGASIEGRGKRKTAPLRITGRPLRGTRYVLPVPSAQVKSALLLAGLYADGPTVVVERVPTRNHTELFMRRIGIPVRQKGSEIRIAPGASPRPFKGSVPGDVSSAAFLIALALLVPGSRADVRNVLWNPTRTGFIRVLKRMKAPIRARVRTSGSMETTADLDVRPGRLRGTVVTAKEIPGLVDEVPILLVIATQAKGVTEVRGAGELRVKETDRIHSMVSQLKKMGANITVKGDDIRIEGPTQLNGCRIESYSDHRTAMSFIIAGMIAKGQTEVRDIANIRTSFPSFLSILRKSGCHFKVSGGRTRSG